MQLGGECGILVTGAVGCWLGMSNLGSYGAETEGSGVLFGQGWRRQPKHLEMATGDKMGVGDVGC